MKDVGQLGEELATQIHYRLVEELAARKRRSDALLDMLSEVVFQADSLGVLRFLNPAWKHVLGYDVADGLGHHLCDFLADPPQQPCTVVGVLERATPRGELAFRHRNGQIVWLHAMTRPDEHGGWVGSLVDVTERKTAEDTLRQTAQKLRHGKLQSELILDGIAEGVVVTDLDGHVLLTNTAARELLGLSDAEILCQLLPDVFRLAGLPDELALAGRAGTPVRCEAPDRWLQVRAQSYIDPDGDVAGTVVILSDVTREQEVTQLKERFLGTISHELKTPLTSIAGYLELLDSRKPGPLNEVQDRFVRVLMGESARLRALIDRLMEVARFGEGRVVLSPERLDVAAVVKELAEPIAVQVEEGAVRMRVSLPSRPLVARVDRNRFCQLVCNLLDNARKYTPEGTIDVVVAEAGREFVLEVSDTGIGIPPAVRERIFTRFYRGPNASLLGADGAGIGLSVVRDVAVLHGGHVSVRGREGGGSTFRVVLPLSLEGS